ncbi:hypothetical protein AVEN_34899-1 [Araneus ventricosus]|uniref:Uncharacterized protein n=1 Tax=Araneus ventricosus TaxID=182803 RepID=A0A4Y2RGK7_ARAVE|nr:hypothetical protein AVEN_34899-1 [Araneus ventricosus]
MDKWLKTGLLRDWHLELIFDLAAMEVTVDQQDDNHEVQRPTDWPVQPVSKSFFLFGGCDPSSSATSDCFTGKATCTESMDHLA